MTTAANRSFWVLGSGYNTGAVIQALPTGSPTGYAFYEGRSLRAAFPADAAISFSKNYRKEIKVLDSLASDLSVPIVSSRIKAVIETHAPEQCEFLPVRVLNHKGKVASEAHFFLNALRIVDFIDMKKTKADRNSFKPDQVDWVKELHVLADAVPPEVRVFRAKTGLDLLFIDDVLHDAFAKQALTGLRLFPAEGWDGDDM